MASFHKSCRSLHPRASLDAITPPLIARVHVVRIDRACSLLTPPVRLAAGRSNKRSHCLALRSSLHASSPRLGLHPLCVASLLAAHCMSSSPRLAARCTSSSRAQTQAAQRHATKHSAMQIIWRIQKKIPRLPALERWTSVLGPQSLGHSSYESLLDKQHAHAYLIRARMEN